ncbi:methylated-DNA--[protein]-cysteine S-methyltransferase [Glaciihabitans sp. INWT7]|uniref:methylated-DNA--[protein]-cysteine S-methyltransferase n=1 Tax=Glaciihabitans sp. INWT7 TaxID=2596912 RepID=UPI0016266A88|nr:methylated-DNA--[protein]-cysteine S-methyltransferase [Glaciihabitans sp. INWT7]QNE46432.1 methylated-DNA--[protein]-cysteine S-methyltransferase [Glaciihabitans sp. INWT7]
MTTLSPTTTPTAITVTPSLALRRLDSPIGRIELVGDGAAVVSLTIERGGVLPHDGQEEHSDAVLDRAATQLSEYFAGTRTSFDVPIALSGTEFQRSVWARLAQLQFGEVISYGDLGLSTGRATAGRAVGGAVGANPVPILVPCHRVLAANSRITGYSGGNGIPTKIWLLDHEGIGHRA